MDVFEHILVPHNNLNNIFDLIVSSSSHGRLKLDDDGQLFKDTLAQIGCTANKTLFIDDSPRNCEAMEKLGGHSYLYHNYQSGYQPFLKWFDSTFQL